MTAAEATLYGALIAGTFALLGVVVERLLRLTGFLRFEASGWDTTYYGGEDARSHGMVDDPKDATAMRYTVAIDLFNGREVPTGLRDVRVEMILDGRSIESRVEDLGTERLRTGIGDRTPSPVYDKLNALNVPPRQFAHKDLRGWFDKEATEAYRDGRWRSIDFVAERPKRPFFGIIGSKTYRKTITEPKD